MKLIDQVIVPLSELQIDHHRPVSQKLVLELLNHAVWAPNHMLREPWRFIYVDRGEVDKLEWFSHHPAAHLIIVIKNSSNPMKQNENIAAAFCLIQNFQLLANERELGVNICVHKWMSDRQACAKLGVSEKETIVAVLELAYGVKHQGGRQRKLPNSLNWSLLSEG
ncbi:Nitroreductase [Evansella caseinilytica]|uniref:Nitroreductase n=1 Tax=Evansella caseinilytica TaxID=1503961 RepID=A0A1H3UC56_9BACI|nr:nitroreductase family protein [Evansella caseinilytica]SDZ60013.1 Nitroreductase [Evansella caseinilytica]